MLVAKGSSEGRREGYEAVEGMKEGGRRRRWVRRGRRCCVKEREEEELEA